MDIKNLNEVLDALELIAQNGKSAFKDKKIDLSDFQYLINLATNFEILQKAVEGIGELPKELKDINAQEAQELILKLINIISKLK